MIDLETLIQKAQNLEPLPASATRLASLVAQPDPQIKDILEVVSLDQALTVRLLRVANSAANVSRMPIKTVREAIIRLGNATVLALAVSGVVRRQMRTALPELGFSEDQLWKHSVAAALATERMASLCSKRIPAETFTAALLHDIGKLVLSRFLSPDIIDLLGRAQSEGGLKGLQAEAELLGVHHAELGSLIAQRWGLPERLGRAIQHHHTPDECEDVVCDAVAVANQIARNLELAPVPQELHREDHRGARDRPGLSEAGLLETFERLNTDFEQTLARFA